MESRVIVFMAFMPFACFISAAFGIIIYESRKERVFHG
jgi:hypothetical protein